ncbi:hypothetical protein C8N35_10775 [Breoghania corrubedonensis]|uniref:BPL/LPL catalytic domain-containing protein n=1 Tax=Breoghania corrubedonensis TaxID=665038 RepID=A0A2T5V6I4_9HYPH|nr:hypothetical protein [Breoghania corrubedonensis]PTW59362.1 hypothetical protein C8N35_10775 [Breoghania corrubedonensis]
MDHLIAEPAPATHGAVLTLFEPGEAAGRFGDIEHLAGEVAAGRRPPSVVFWRAARALTVTDAQTRLPGFAAARKRLGHDGWPIVVRKSGGGAFPVEPGTLQISLLTPRDTPGLSFDALHWRLANLIQLALVNLGVPSEIREVGRAFCPGRFDVAVGDQKIAGLSQAGSVNGAVVADASILIDEDPNDAAVAVNLFNALTGSSQRCDPAAGLALHDLTRASMEAIYGAFLAAAELPAR